MSEIQNNADLLADASGYAKLKQLFSLHKEANSILGVVYAKKEPSYFLDRFETIIKQEVSKGGGRLLNVTRKEFLEAKEPAKTVETTEPVESNFAKAVEVEAEKETSENPFADESEADKVENEPAEPTKERKRK
jgi:hypothetical protein